MNHPSHSQLLNKTPEFLYNHITREASSLPERLATREGDDLLKVDGGGH